MLRVECLFALSVCLVCCVICMLVTAACGTVASDKFSLCVNEVYPDPEGHLHISLKDNSCHFNLNMSVTQ